MSKSKRVLATILSVAMFLGIFSCSTPVFAQSITDAVEHHEFVQNAINN